MALLESGLRDEVKTYPFDALQGHENDSTRYHGAGLTQ